MCFLYHIRLSGTASTARFLSNFNLELVSDFTLPVVGLFTIDQQYSTPIIQNSPAHEAVTRLFEATCSALQAVNASGNFRFGATTVSPQSCGKPVVGVMVSGCSRREVNGFYAAESIPGYHGARTFRKPGTDLAVYRWKHRMWLIGDLGSQMRSIGMDTEHGRTHTYCRVESSADLPPEDGWSTEGEKSDVVRVASGTLNVRPASAAVWQWCDESSGKCSRQTSLCELCRLERLARVQNS